MATSRTCGREAPRRARATDSLGRPRLRSSPTPLPASPLPSPIFIAGPAAHVPARSLSPASSQRCVVGTACARRAGVGRACEDWAGPRRRAVSAGVNLELLPFACRLFSPTPSTSLRPGAVRASPSASTPSPRSSSAHGIRSCPSLLLPTLFHRGTEEVRLFCVHGPPSQNNNNTARFCHPRGSMPSWLRAHTEHNDRLASSCRPSRLHHPTSLLPAPCALPEPSSALARPSLSPSCVRPHSHQYRHNVR